MALWQVKIGQDATIRTQDRVVDVRTTEKFGHSEFVVTVQNPISTERSQAKGRINNAIIQIKRGDDILIEGFIEDVENGADFVKYIGRSFLMLLGYTTSSETASGGATEAEYEDDTGVTIINDLINSFCVPHDAEITYTDVTFAETYDGIVKLHGKKVYDIIRNMCIDYSRDLWSDATWNGDGINIDNKNIHVGTKSRGNAGAPHKTLYGGQHLKNIPVVRYRSSQNVINRIRVIGKGSGKEKVSVIVDDAASQATYGVIEGAPYNNNMIITETTAKAVGQAIIDAKKDLVEELHVELITYISDLKYGDWVNIIDSYSNVDTTQRIKQITRMYDSRSGDSMSIEIGMPFDNYETLIKDLTKGDVDPEIEMSKQGGSLRITANDPPSDWIRYDPGDWYDTTGVFQTKGKGVCPFWTYADNPATGTYKKALIQISDAGSVTYKVGTQYASKTDAQNESVSVDALNIPLGEVILKGKAVGGGGYTVEDVYSDDQGDSYIYRDVRPIIGSSATGLGGSSPWEVSGSYSQLITARPIDMQGYDIINISDLKGSLNSDFSLYGSNSADSALVEFLQWDHSTEQILINRNTDLYDATVISPELKFRVPLDEGYSGFYVDYHSTDGLLRFRDINADSSVMTLSDSGILTLIDDLWMTKGKEINFGTPNTAYIYQDAVTEDLKFYDSVLAATKTLSELAAGGVPSGGVQGDIIYHDAADWVRLAAGTSGYVLQSQGAAANPVWAKGLPTSPSHGDVVYYNGSNWVSLAAGASGSYLKTLGAGNNPVWFNVAAGFVTDPLTSNLDADGYDINDLGDIDFRTSLSYAYINFDSNNDFLRYDCGNDVFEFKIGDNIRFSIETEEINAYYNLDMNSKDIIKCKDVKGQTTGTDGANRLNLDFRGDGNHRIYYTGIADDRMKRETSSGGHLFAVSSADICQIHTNGINMASGKYIKSDSGDLELRAPSGSKIKFVIG